MLKSDNTYKGNTRIQEGVLGVSSPCLYRNADVYVSTGAKFDLNFTGTNRISCLYLGGQRYTAGVFGRDAEGGPTWFSGSGFLKVEPGTTFIIR